MSGPVRTDDAPTETGADAGAEAGRVTREAVEVTTSREADVGGHRVRRALPRRDRRTVGAWCFADHIGPASVAEDMAGIGPHPHIGLQTVTWLVAGEMVHRDSLGSEQTIRPGQLNLMTAGRGVVHAEEGTGRYRGDLHGIQLWVAQPEATRHGAPAFEHHGELPRVEVGEGVATVLVGELGGTASPARRDTDHLGTDIQLGRGRAEVPLRPEHEHALVVLEGAVGVGGADAPVTPGHLAYLGPGPGELTLTAPEPARLLLLGGVPFESRILMWWNFVARRREEVDAARHDWLEGSDRFGDPGSRLPAMDMPVPPWQ